MTVLGFDNITWAYALLQCVPEWVLGILVAVSGFCGVAGSRTYPHLRTKLGVERSGVVGMSILVFCLTFCVLSIWLPGTILIIKVFIFLSGSCSKAACLFIFSKF